MGRTSWLADEGQDVRTINVAHGVRVIEPLVRMLEVGAAPSFLPSWIPLLHEAVVSLYEHGCRQ